MTADFNIPYPIKYKLLKHHKSSIIRYIKQASDYDMKCLAEKVQSNYIDLYTGHLSPLDVCRQIEQLLQHKTTWNKPDFLNWINKKPFYRMLTIGDGSEWIIRKGNDARRYVHIHPSRSGLYTLRFKGTTLITTFKLLQKYTSHAFIPPLHQVNQARKELALSPVKRLDQNQGILKCWLTLSSDPI